MQVTYVYYNSIIFIEFLWKLLLHGRNSVYEEYTDCIIVFVIYVPEFQKTNSDHLRKLTIWHTTSVAIFWDNFKYILRPSLPEKLNGQHSGKMNIKTVVIYIPMSNYSLFGKIQIVGPNLAKRKNDKNFKK